MVRRRPAAVIGALCVSIAVVGASAATGQSPAGGMNQIVDTGSRAAVTDLPVLSELPPLPTEGESPEEPVGDAGPVPGMSAVQTGALALAAGVLVAGVVGLTLVTRRGRSEGSGERPAPAGPVG